MRGDSRKLLILLVATGLSVAAYFVNLSWWNKLTPENRKFLEDAFKELTQKQWQFGGVELTQDGIDCNSGRPTCKVGTLDKDSPMVEVKPTEPDKALLKAWLRGKPADRPVFKTPPKLAPMLRADLRRAKAAWIRESQDPAERRERRRSDFLAEVDSAGRVVDFHGQRNTFITLLARSGATVKEAQTLARSARVTDAPRPAVHTALGGCTLDKECSERSGSTTSPFSVSSSVSVSVSLSVSGVDPFRGFDTDTDTDSDSDFDSWGTG